MLTFIEAISLAGDRAKQNDDACGAYGDRAWVIDGATDLHDTPLTGWASDASWIASTANAQFNGSEGLNLPLLVHETSVVASQAFQNAVGMRTFERWQSPIASLLIIEDLDGEIAGLDLGDCRVFALDADGDAHVVGGPGDAGDNESKLAARQTDAHKPLLQRTQTIDTLRRIRASINRPGGEHWTFGLDPACADHARTWSLELKRPAHLLLMTDGFAALTDRYSAYGPGDLVQAALTRGLQELGRELRQIEAADAGGAKHPRFKASDDATALLMRLS
ncbi:MAG: protein phosphatase 2C domain-containing protein [Proteobacteria bacterium]|nr:protein phosphatase 2C domain-containing protein [Pseudomonadota bacterium]